MPQKEPERIAIPELQKKLDSGLRITIVDVRKPAEIEESGAVPGAIRVPVDEVASRSADFPKSGAIAFYCGGGGRASRAAQALWNLGRRNIYYFGMRDWKRRGLPTTK